MDICIIVVLFLCLNYNSTQIKVVITDFVLIGVVCLCMNHLLWVVFFYIRYYYND